MRSWRWIFACLVLQGCVRPDLVACENGILCPQGTMCWEEERTCVDPQGLTLAEGPFDFGALKCGQGSELVVELQNRGITPIPFDASSTLDGITVTPAHGSVAPGGSLALRIEAAALAMSTPGEPLVGTLVVETYLGRMERTIRLTTIGGVASVEPIVDFGERMVGSTYEDTLEITNTGNAPFSVTATVGGMGFSLGDDTLVEVAPMATASIPVEFSPSTLRTFTGTVALAYDETLCQPAADTVGMVGVVSGSPLEASRSLLTFENAGCGDPAATKTFTLTNRLSAAQTLSLRVAGDHPDDFAVDPTASVGAGGMTTIEVRRKANPSVTSVGDRRADLVISAAPSGETKTIPLSHRIVGSMLRATPREVVFVVEGLTHAQTKAIELVNTGNEIANVTTVPASITQSGSTVSILQNPFQVLPGASTSVSFGASTGQTSASNTHIIATVTMSAGNQCSEPVQIAVDADFKVTQTMVPEDPD